MGALLGAADGAFVGRAVGIDVGYGVGAGVGYSVGDSVGYAVGAGVFSHWCLSSDSWLTCCCSVAKPVGHSHSYPPPPSFTQLALLDP